MPDGVAYIEVWHDPRTATTYAVHCTCLRIVTARDAQGDTYTVVATGCAIHDRRSPRDPRLMP
jgi:hypothetical protein